MTTHVSQPAVEWVAGLLSSPAYVTGEGEPFRPRLLVLACPEYDEPVLACDLLAPDEPLEGAADRFAFALHETARKRLPPPRTVRTSSPDLADVLRRGIGARVKVVLDATPEIDLLAKSMAEFMRDVPRDEPATYLHPGMTPEVLEPFFAAAARLYRTKPWKIVPADASVLRVDIPSLGIRDAALSVIGQLGQSLGWILFPSLDAFEEYGAAGEAFEAGEELTRVPRHMALNFERAGETELAMRLEVKAHGWKLGGRDAYPWVVVVDEDMVGRPPTARELLGAESICVALADMIENEKSLKRAWRRGATVSRTVRVPTAGGEIELTLSAPFFRWFAEESSTGSKKSRRRFPDSTS